MEPIIRLNNVVKTIKDKTILEDITFEVYPGDFIGITGPSGAGKTSLLNMIGLLDQPSSGEYYIGERPCTSMTAKEEAQYRNEIFGFVMQDFALIEKYSVMQNIQIPIVYCRKQNIKKESKLRMLNLLEEFGLLEKSNQIVSTLSGGERQRVAVIRALINDPKIILADEPASALDRENADYIYQVLTELNKNGKTILVVTHDVEAAKKTKKRIIMQSGCVWIEHN